MKICIVNSFYPPWIGGAETYVSSLAKCLVRDGHEVTVYCAHNPLSVGETFEDGVRVRRMRAPFRLYGTPIAVSPLNIFFDDFDIVHCNFPSPYLAALFSFFARARRIPSVLTWHNDLPPVTSAAGILVRSHDLLAPGYLAQYKKIIATTAAYAKSSRTLRSYAKKVVVISNGVDTIRFNPGVDGEKVRKMHGLENKRVVLFVGALTRWHAYKGLDTLVRAFAISSKQLPNCHLLIVGGGELATYNQRLAHDLGLDGSVTFAGNVTEELLPNYYAACDLFVLPSRDRSEGYGLAILEAMASGKPAIGSSVGGIVDVIQNHDTGLLVNPSDPESLSDAVLLLLRDDDARRRMGVAARKFAEQNDWRQVARQVEALYEQLTGISGTG